MNILASLKSDYIVSFPSEAAQLIESNPSLVEELDTLPTEALLKILDRLDPYHLPRVFMGLAAEVRKQVLETANVRLALIILRSLETDVAAQLLDELDELGRSELNKLLQFSNDTAGYYMDRPQAQFRTDDTIKIALQKLQDSQHHSARSIYVVDDSNELKGRVDLQDMAIASGNTLLNTLMNVIEGSVVLTSPRQDLLDIFEKSRTDSIPVLDLEAKLIGVIRYGSLFQAVGDQATADLQKMVGASAEERALSSATFAVKKRLPWLHINLLTAFLAAAVVGLFEATIAQFTALAILLPVVAGQSGNAGSQALAVTMRGLALKEISILQWRVVLSKEVKVGIIDGVALAITCGLGVYFWSASFGLALVIAIAMIVAMIAAGVSGALVPMMLIRAGQDPATAASIILTTVTDVAGFTAFLGTATLLAFML
ncbi:MAG: magnesium transporter [Candidatus Azotimanducaceae bacterium]|jgi:magnesium transporter